MKRLAVFSLLFAGIVTAVSAAVPQQRRGQATTQSAPAAGATAARSAVSARSATARSAAPAPTATTAARSATAGRTTVARGGTTAAAPTTVSARAGVTQKVIGTGTKVAAATKNTVVSEACQQKYDGCMDSFCMLDNDTGGRCICSNRNAELDDILAEIEKLDQQSYQMATAGVERIEMGADADAAIASANAAAQSVMKAEQASGSKRRTLDLSMWDTFTFDDDEDIFGEGNTLQSVIDGKQGDALHRAAAELCVAQMPECANEISMLQMMYAQKIKNDCSAYENSLKQQKNSSAQKLAAAEKALREAALDQLRTANKYDLGQCTVEFKKCMASTGGCGDDFKGCVGIAASEQIKGQTPKQVSITGSKTKITIAASTYDTLEAKKPMCMSVTNSCVAVADQVWDTFMREVAPQLKTAELLAESDLRTSCISNISDCFQKACKDTIDPNDPDGSYDMCLSRPETVKSLCKVQIDPCVAAEPLILDFVYARLAAMRVDACTNDVKNCLQDDDRCGKDYTQCVGLDTDTIIRMCPYDKLVGCQQVYSGESGKQSIRDDAVYDVLANMVQGIMLSIDNNMLEYCQNAANEAMIKVCGDTENCNGLAVDENIGARSLDYKICEYTSSGDSLDINYSRCRTDVSQIQDSELGRIQGATQSGLGPVTPFAGVLDGTIYWESVDFDDDGMLSSVDEYIEKTGSQLSTAQKEKVKSELAVLQKNINTAINAIEADPTVQYCMTGRQVQGMKDMRIGRGQAAPRFPELTKQMRLQIATAALKTAKDSYYKKYDQLQEKMLQDYATMGERMAEIAGENALDARREIARIACISFAEAASLPKSPNPPKNAFGKVLSMVAIAGAAVAVPFTAGLSTTVIAGLGMSAATAATVAAGAGAVGVSAIGLLGNAGSGSANGADGGVNRELIGSKQLNQWNYKETITSTFEWDTLNCHKCVRAQNCNKKGNPLFGSKYCKSWADPVETCTDTQF